MILSHTMHPIISAGAVIFRRDENREPLFLLLYHGRGYWNFPKGRVEKGEKVMGAFFREVEEETGLKRRDLSVISGFQARDRYFMSGPGPRAGGRISYAHGVRRAQLKIVIFYLVETKERNVAVSEEHQGFGWFTLREANHIAKYQSTKDILKKAHAFIRKDIPSYARHSDRESRHLR